METTETSSRDPDQLVSWVHPDGYLTLCLPLPARAISPNARRGESRGAAIRKSRVVKSHRLLAKLCCGNARLRWHLEGQAYAGYCLAFFWKTAAFRDDDNADASCKAYRDGIAEALKMDDRQLRKLALSTHAKDAGNPRVEFTLIPLSPPSQA
jgi:hypothetical protein